MQLKMNFKTTTIELHKYLLRGDIHTQVAMLNVYMTLEAETPTPPLPPLMSSVVTNIPLFQRKTKKSYF